MSTDAASAPRRRVNVWLLGLIPLALVGLLVAALFAFDLPGLSRNGIPVEDVAVERTVLRPGEIELTLRNDGPDAVRIAQVVVNDAYVPGAAIDPPEVGRLGSSTVRIPYDWIEGEAYEVSLLTSTGGIVSAPIEVANETPAGDADFFGFLALLGLYVGVIPVSIGMLWMPFVRRVSTTVVRFFLALTVGLLAFLAVDALVEGFDIGSTGPQAFGGPTLVLLGALVAFIALMAVDAFVKARAVGTEGYRLSLLIAIGIGLHNLGEGLAIGSAYAIGELALGAFLVVGFALHNTTEGLAVVAPIAHDRPRWPRLLGLGLIAGGPAIVGAWIGGVAYSAPVASFLLGFGVGAILQVAWQLLPTLRGKERGARIITPLTAAGLASGLLIMYATGLLAG